MYVAVRGESVQGGGQSALPDGNHCACSHRLASQKMGPATNPQRPTHTSPHPHTSTTSHPCTRTWSWGWPSRTGNYIVAAVATTLAFARAEAARASRSALISPATINSTIGMGGGAILAAICAFVWPAASLALQVKGVIVGGVCKEELLHYLKFYLHLLSLPNDQYVLDQNHHLLTHNHIFLT